MVEVQSLRKCYGALTAVDDVSFTVRQGEVFGFLGPNGAGKTTCLEMMEGLRRPDSGKVLIKNLSVWPEPGNIKYIIGVQFQASAFYEELTVQEILQLFAALHGRKLTSPELDGLLEMGGLTEKRHAYTGTISGGQKQRLAILTALVNVPEVVFLDEPTTGLDPQARRRSWEVIKELQNRGKTIILTSHYMEEAEYLCDRVAIIDYGKIVALDEPRKLIDKLGEKTKISFTSSRPLDGALTLLPGAEVVKAGTGESQVLLARDPGQAIAALLEAARSEGAVIKNLQVSAPNLEDVFLTLTGKELRD
jgi:ABC-2 type transport system ATP-binding protein